MAIFMDATGKIYNKSSADSANDMTLSFPTAELTSAATSSHTAEAVVKGKAQETRKSNNGNH